MTARIKTVLFFYFLVVVSLLLYSFTQVDLSLTLSRNLLLNSIVDAFQNIGYFHRPLSAYLFIGIIVFLFGFYLYFLKLASKNILSKKFVWKLILATSTILVFSYNAFSYDLFNYIFDAKIFTHYGLNPYLYKALDFPTDPMLSFMRWTHRVYPYGPFWLILTIPLSYIGVNFFLPTFFLFKFLTAASFIGSLYFIGKIFQKIAPKREVAGLVFFGLNPLILVESLVSSHLDISMMFFALFAFYKLLDRKYLWAFVLLFLSFEIKFATALLFPVFAYVVWKKNKVSWDKVFLMSSVLMLIAVVATAIYSGNFQPWYLILPMTFAVFLVDRYYAFIPAVIVTFFALLNYVPYLYLGNWDPPVPEILLVLQVFAVAFSVIGVFAYSLLKNKEVSIKN
jgi:hypothetical protein